MKCTVCGIGTAKIVQKKNYPARYKGEPVEVPVVEVYSCDHCGEELFTPELAHTLLLSVKNEVRKKLGLLPPERIVSIRNKAGLTQEELEELVGQGEKVVTRWESGKVIQNVAADTLLRLIERDPDLVKKLREIEKQRAKLQEQYSLRPAKVGVQAASR